MSRDISEKYGGATQDLILIKLMYCHSVFKLETTGTKCSRNKVSRDLGKLYTTLARRTCHVNIYLMIRLRTVMLNPLQINCGKVTNTLQKRQFILPCIGCPIMNITKVQNQGPYIYVSLFIGHVSMSTTGLSSNVSF